MIKKQLSVLAGSVLVAAGANAAIVGGASGVDSSAILVLNTAGQGSYVYDTGITAGDLASGTGFSIDISAGIAALGGSVDAFAVFGTLGGTSNVYSYAAGYNYVDVNGGVVYTSTAPSADQVNLSLLNNTNAVRDYINSVAAGGLFADGNPGDLDAEVINSVFGLLTGSGLVANVYTQTLLAGEDATGSTQLVEITSPAGSQLGAYLDGPTGNATSAVPVPAAAWLFGSALLGLGVVRRKA